MKRRRWRDDQLRKRPREKSSTRRESEGNERTNLLDLEITKVLQMHQPIGTQPSSSNKPLHDQRSLSLLSLLVLDPSQGTLVHDPSSTSSPRNVLRRSLAEMSKSDRRVGGDRSVEDLLLGREEVADEGEERLEGGGGRRSGRGGWVGRLNRQQGRRKKNEESA